MAVASPGWISGDASSCFLAALDLAALVLATLGILVKNVFSDGLMLHATSDTALGDCPATQLVTTTSEQPNPGDGSSRSINKGNLAVNVKTLLRTTLPLSRNSLVVYA
jgi:hypothetical protein